MGTRTFRSPSTSTTVLSRPVVALLEAVGATGAEPVRVVVGQHDPAGARLGPQDLGPGDPRHLGRVDHGAHRRRHRTREREAHLEEDPVARVVVAHDLAHGDVVAGRASLVEGRRAVGRHRPRRRHRDRLPDGEFHVGGTRRWQPQLAVVPAHGPLHVELHRHPLVQHGLEERLELVRVRPVVALEDTDAERPQLVRVVDDLRLADQLHAPELLVVVAVLEEEGEAGVAAQVLHLLRLGLGLHRDAAVEEPVPHGHRVDGAVGGHGAHRHGPPLGEERLDLVGRHLYGLALIHAVAHGLGHLAPPKSCVRAA